MKINQECAGRYKLTIRNADGSIKDEGEWFDNLILDAGLNRFGTGSIANFASVGSGSVAPLNTDTVLGSKIAHSNSQTGYTFGVGGTNTTTDPYHWWQRVVIRFGEGVAAGNLSEVGMGWDGTNLASRSLIKDTGGAPTTITVLSNEILDVTYEFRCYPALADSTFSLVIGAITHTVTVRPSRVTQPLSYGAGALLSGSATAWPFDNAGLFTNGDMAAITGGLPSGTFADIGNAPLSAYANNSLERVLNVTADLGTPGAAPNYSDFIRSLVVQMNYSRYQFQFEPRIQKNATNRLTLQVVVAWSRRSI